MCEGDYQVKPQTQKICKLSPANERLPEEPTGKERLKDGSRQNGALFLTRNHENGNRIPEGAQSRQRIRIEEEYVHGRGNPYSAQEPY